MWGRTLLSAAFDVDFDARRGPILVAFFATRVGLLTLLF